jgi:hypothetical protein
MTLTNTTAMSIMKGFPMCMDGDVLIHVSGTEAMKLHSGLLRVKSEFFAEFFAVNPGAQLSAGAKKAGEARWRLDVVTTPDRVGGRLNNVVSKYNGVLNNV